MGKEKTRQEKGADASEKRIKNNRDHRVTIRFTEEEFAKLNSDMENHDYLSMAKYCRDCILDKKINVKNVTMTDRKLRNMINSYTTQIARIGNNYNNVVRKYEATCNLRKNDGSPAISTRATIRYIDELTDLMKMIHEVTLKTIDIVDNATKDNKKEKP
jgi:anti-sigma-K factor RskA